MHFACLHRADIKLGEEYLNNHIYGTVKGDIQELRAASYKERVGTPCEKPPSAIP